MALRDLDLRRHDLRHEAASRWREQGLDLREIQLLLGHSAQRYINVTDDDLATADEREDVEGEHGAATRLPRYGQITTRQHFVSQYLLSICGAEGQN